MKKKEETIMLQTNHTINQAGHFAVAGVDTVSLAEKYGTPLYVLDEDLIRSQMSRYVSAVKAYLPAGSKPFFASKALSFKEMYRIAQSEGMGTDIVSAGELYTALAAGFGGENMCFHGSAKTRAEIRYGIKSGVGHFVVDNEQELRWVSEIAQELGTTQKVLLRLTPGIDPHTFEAVNTGKADSKFGMSIETGQAMDFIQLALKLSGLEVVGFHCHIGSQIADEKPFQDAVDIMLEFMTDVRSETGYTATVLNLGGGPAVPYADGEPDADIEAQIRDTGLHLKKRCLELSYPEPAVWLEPGRSIVGAAGVTLYTVQNVKIISGYKNYIAIDGGMTDNPRYALYGARHPALIANRAGEPAEFVADLAGRCCESGDLIGEEMSIQKPEAGDTVAVLVTGAYNYSMASNYNRVPRPPVVMLRNGEDRLVVRRETLEDIVACDL